MRERFGSQLEPSEIYEVLSPSLFGGHRLLVVRNAHEIRSGAVPEVVPLLVSPPDDVTVVLHHPGGARGKAVLDAARSAHAIRISCARLGRFDERLDFIRGEVRRAGGSITPDGAAALLDAVGPDLRDLAAVCGQLVSDSGGRGDAAGVAAYHRGRAEVGGFAVSDRAIVGDVSGALENLRWALGVGVPAVVIADALADGARSVARVSAASSGRANSYELAQRLGMPPWKVKRAQGQSRGWSEAGIRQAMVVVAGLNADVKGVAVDPGFALERAITALATARTLR